jgi:hypothetical protein
VRYQSVPWHATWFKDTPTILAPIMLGAWSKDDQNSKTTKRFNISMSTYVFTVSPKQLYVLIRPLHKTYK